MAKLLNKCDVDVHFCAYKKRLADGMNTVENMQLQNMADRNDANAESAFVGILKEDISGLM